MTQDELDQLPDVTTQQCALFQDEDDGTFQDLNGTWWLTGWLNGQHVKRLFGPAMTRDRRAQA